MPEVSQELLHEVLGEVLADTAFTFVEPSEEAPEWTAPVVSAAITFETDRRGRVRISAGTGTATEIAANMLGVEPGDPEAAAQAQNAVLEILNVIGGALIVKLYGTAQPSRLGIPEASVGPFTPGPGACTISVRTETGEPIQLALELEDAGGGR
jgi:CheY-specific phosphatase CheX